MLRKFSTMLIVVSCFGSAAHAQQVVSYHFDTLPANTKVVVIPSMPQGFVLTDILHEPGGNNATLHVYERQNDVDVTKTKLYQSRELTARSSARL